MSLRKRSSSKPSLSRALNKMRVNSNRGIVEIESWVDFASNHDNDVDKLVNPSQLSIKDKSKEQFMNCQLQRREMSKCLKNMALNIKCFLNSKDLRMKCFQK